MQTSATMSEPFVGLRRWLVVGIAAVAAFWLYIDRVCFSTLADPIRTDLGLSEAERDLALGMFFFTYALFQVPVGMLADRYGARRVLTLAIASWSLVTLATGLVEGFVALAVARLLLGVTEAGAYPAAAGLIKVWTRPQERGRFSSLVALGGRIGGAVAPWLTVGTVAILTGLWLGPWPQPSGVPWRGVFFVYGLCGLTVALLFWLVVRDQPTGAPTSPAATLPAANLRTLGLRLWDCLRSANLLLFGLMQFGVNLGWGFLITLMPTYLNEEFAVPLEQRGQMQSAALFIGCCGMFCGGLLTDACRGWFGPVWGRRIPLAVALVGCFLALVSVPWLPTPWVAVAVLGLMAFLVDLHNPVIWAFAQDVGGRNVGVALGFGNMLGNLGAALSPVLLGAVRRSFGWDAAFFVGAVAFAIAAVAAVRLDPTRPFGQSRP